MKDQPHNEDATDLDSLHAAAKREKPDVQPGREPAPVWVFVASMAAMLFAGGYAGGFVGGFNFDNNSPFVGEPKDVRPIVIEEGADLSPLQASMKRGANVYNNCQGCHQASGGGQPGAIPPLAGSDWVLGGTERIARVVLHGLVGPVKVKGANYAGSMDAFGSKLSDKEVADVITFIRNSWGNQATMVTPAMVAEVREATKDHTGQYKNDELEPFAAKDIPGELPADPAAAPAAAPAP